MSETNTTLNGKTVAELRAICKARGIAGMTKKRKDIIISAILEKNSTSTTDSAPAAIAKAEGVSSYTQEYLNEKTAAELRAMCKNLGILGMSKKRKDILVAAIFTNESAEKITSNKITKVTPVKIANSGPVTAAQFGLQSILTSPNAQKGNKTTTTIQVSCGANTSEFPVVGKTVGAVQEFLKEVLNIDRIATGQINGKSAEANYILAEGDVLEFIKPAGRKG